MQQPRKAGPVSPREVSSPSQQCIRLQPTWAQFTYSDCLNHNTRRPQCTYLIKAGLFLMFSVLASFHFFPSYTGSFFWMVCTVSTPGKNWICSLGSRQPWRVSPFPCGHKLCLLASCQSRAGEPSPVSAPELIAWMLDKAQSALQWNPLRGLVRSFLYPVVTDEWPVQLCVSSSQFQSLIALSPFRVTSRSFWPPQLACCPHLPAQELQLQVSFSKLLPSLQPVNVPS